MAAGADRPMLTEQSWRKVMNGNRRRTWVDRFVDSWIGIITILVLVCMIGYGFYRYVVIPNTVDVVVYKSWATKEIRKVEDLQGNVLTNYDLSKLRYDQPIWIK
jgi:hypothetical protein